MTFLPQGILLQSNPHEGNREDSDSGGQGVWQVRASSGGEISIVAKFVEFKADRSTGSYLGKGVVRLEFDLEGDFFSGFAAAFRYGVNNEQLKGPLLTPVRGRRITLSAAELAEPLGWEQ
jgi:hypothetical protein